MKILVFSDSHGNVDYMRRAVELEQPDHILHLGDVVPDAEKLHLEYPRIPMEMVRGNCDGWDETPEEKIVTLGGKQIWMLHGHTYRVKVGIGLMVMNAHEKGVDAVVFGHTHEPLCTMDGSLWIMNPGTVRGYPKATYGVIDIDKDKIYCHMADFK